MSIPINVTDSGLLISGPGLLEGIIVNSHTSGTLKIWDTASPSVPVQAVTDFTSSGAVTVATHASADITSTGASVAGTHAVTVFTKTGQFLDAAKGTGVLTSDQTQPTAAQVVVLGAVTYTFVALGAGATQTATAVAVPLGNNTLETMNNLYNAMIIHPLVDVVRTSAYVITVTAKTAGVAGNLTATENSAHLAWDDGSTLLLGIDAETITIGSKVYTWKTVLDATDTTATAIQVIIGSTLTVSLANLRKAINATGTSGNQYSQGLGVADPNVVCSASDGTTFTLRGRVPGTSLNTVATTETCAGGSFPDTTLGGGTGASDPGVTTAAATITIGAITYTQVDALSETYGAVAIPYQILRGASEATMLDALKLAINGSGVAGTDYGTSTVAHALVIATTNTDTVQTIRSRTPGIGNNTLATTESMANTAWGGTTLGGAGNTAGVTTAGSTFTINGRTYTAVIELSETLGAAAIVDQILWTGDEATFLDNVKLAINASGTAGTQYSTGTTPNVDVKATVNTNTVQTLVARKGGTAGNSLATTETMANYAFTSTVMASGLGTTASVLVNTITLPATAALTTFDRLIDFEDMDFARGLYVTVGGTADVTCLVEL